MRSAYSDFYQFLKIKIISSCTSTSSFSQRIRNLYCLYWYDLTLNLTDSNHHFSQKNPNVFEWKNATTGFKTWKLQWWLLGRKFHNRVWCVNTFKFFSWYHNVTCSCFFVDCKDLRTVGLKPWENYLVILQRDSGQVHKALLFYN